MATKAVPGKELVMIDFQLLRLLSMAR